MFMPTRIDHHGWQLALLALAIAGDRRSASARAAALTLGLATALSLAIGLEMLIYLALAGGGDGAVLGRRPRRARAAGGLCGDPGGRHRARLPALRLLRQPRSRCATRCRRCGCRDALLGGALLFGLALAVARATGSAGSRWPPAPALVDRRLPRLDLAALPVAPRRRVARSRAAVAEPCARGAADLPPRLADRGADARRLPVDRR